MEISKSEYVKGTIFEEGFGLISLKVMTSQLIPTDVKTLYAYLSAFSDNINIDCPSKRKICSDLLWDNNKLDKVLKKSEELGLLKEVEKNKRKIYIILLKTEDISVFNSDFLESDKSISNQNVDSIWSNIKIMIKNKISDVSFKTWIAQGIKNVKLENNILILYVPNEFTKNIISSKYKYLIMKVINLNYNFIKDIEFKLI